MASCSPVSIALNTASLSPGAYTGIVTIADPNAIDSPATVTLSLTVGNVPSSVRFYVTPAGMSSYNIYPQSPVSITVSTASGGNWLSVSSPPSGSFQFGNPYVITATALPGMSAGTYTGSVTVSGSTNAADNQTMGVTLTVTASPLLQTTNTPVQLTAAQGGTPVSTTYTPMNVGQGTLSIYTATAGATMGNFLSASVQSGNRIAITADPSQLTPGTYSGTVGLTSNAADNSDFAIPVQFTVTAGAGPVISQNGIVNAATFVSEAVAPGDIVSLFGDQFTAQGTTATANAVPLATQLGGIRVLVNGAPAPVYYASRKQINFQMPYSVTAGQVANVQVVSGSGAGNIRSIPIVAAAPRLLLFPSTVVSGSYGAIVNADGSLAFPTTGTYGSFATHPAAPGSTVTLYAIGLGQTSPGAATGAAASSTTLETVSGVSVLVGSTTLTPAYAGLTPTAVGLYQVNVTLPANIPTGASTPVSILMNGGVSNVVYLPVSSN
jgi:uncharacterized protein (TIGR03437 family)